MKTTRRLKNILTISNIPWLILLFAYVALSFAHCAKRDDPAKEGPANTGQPPVNTISDETAITQAMGSLAIGYSGDDNADRVTANITLPTMGTGNDGEDNGVVITWESSDDDVVNVKTPGTGMVNRPDTADTMVTLTATLTKGDAMDTTTFTLTVIITDSGVVQQALSSLTIGYSGDDNASSVTENIMLPLTGADDITIAWESDNATVIDVETTPGTGMVNRPDTADAMVTLTATATKGDAMDTTTFTLTVIITDAAAVQQALSSLMIGYSGDDNASSVKENIMLPLTGVHDVTISWISDNDAVIDVETTPGTGMVTRPFNTMDAMVTLTATVTKGGVNRTKDFGPLTVIVQLFAWSQVALAENASIWPARWLHTAVAFDNKIWTIAGTTSGLNRLDDVWSSSDGTSWTKVTDSPGWSVRNRHASVVFDNKIWVMGGNDGRQGTETTDFENDVWSSDGMSWKNANARGPTERSKHWSKRAHHAAVVFDGKIWVLGGNDGSRKNDGRKNDVWSSSDGTSWKKVTNSAGWSKRQNHAAVVFDGKMWVLGGNDGIQGTETTNFENDVWSSSDGMSWTKTTVSGTHWSKRKDHAVAVFNGKILVMGGYDGSNYLNDVWWSANGSDWTQLTNGTTHWADRGHHRTVVLGNKMFLFGGFSETTDESSHFNDVWVFQQTNN